MFQPYVQESSTGAWFLFSRPVEDTREASALATFTMHVGAMMFAQPGSKLVWKCILAPLGLAQRLDEAPEGAQEFEVVYEAA